MTEHSMQPSRLLRRSEVEKMTGLSRSAIYAKMATNSFPKPVPLGGNSVAWVEAEVCGWIQSRINERNQRKSA